MKRLLLPIFALLLVSHHAIADDGIKWGQPVNGLRIGVKNAVTSATADQNLAFTVMAQNVSSAPITIPSPDTFVSAANLQSDDYHIAPLNAVQDSVTATHPQALSYGGNRTSETGPSIDKLHPAVITLAPGQTVTWPGIPLEVHFYYGDRLHDGNRTSVESLALTPDFTYRFHFHFFNEQKRVAKNDVWTGQADSDAFTLAISSPGLDGMHVVGTFTLPKLNYYLGEPIKLTFTVTNQGAMPIAYMAGGDYRSTGRHDRFTIKAISASGQPVVDPVKPSGFGGGIGGDVDLQPGGSRSEDLFVNQWCAFTAPGTYMVTCRRTLGVVRTDKNSNPIGMMGEEFKLPKVPVVTTFTITLSNEPATLGAQLTALLPADLKKGELNQDTYWQFACAAEAQSPSAFPVIEKLLDGGPDLQRCAVDWLGKYPTNQTAPILTAAAAKMNPDGRIQLLSYFSNVNAPESGLFIAQHLHDPDARVRDFALMMCTYRGYDACTPLVLKMAAQSGPHDRRDFLAMALGVTGDPCAIPILLAWLNDPPLRTLVALNLGKFKRLDGVPVLITQVRKARNREDASTYLEPLDTLTGQHSGDNRAACLAWWDKTGRAEYEKR